MKNIFKAGDVVTCKWHSHPMTVSLATDNSVYCVWFVGNMTNAANYAPEELTLSDEQPMPGLNLGGMK